MPRSISLETDFARKRSKARLVVCGDVCFGPRQGYERLARYAEPYRLFIDQRSNGVGKLMLTRCISRPGRPAFDRSRYGVRLPLGSWAGNLARRSNPAAVIMGTLTALFARVEVPRFR